MDSQKSSSGDSEGLVMEFGNFKGEQVSYPAIFTGLLKKLEQLESFKMRQNDVWLLCYARSGQFYNFCTHDNIY